MLEIKNLEVTVDGKVILNNISLSIQKGQICALMGRNGSGKSSLAKVIMGYPGLKVRKGTISFNGKSILKLSPEERAKLGIFLAFQNPVEVPGVTFRSYLRLAYNSNQPKARQMSVFKFNQMLHEKCKTFKIDPELLSRGLNENLSGGERKKTEILQMAVLKPKLVILDEIDSGLDIDSLKTIIKGLVEYHENNPDVAIMIISHYEKVFSYIKPDNVYIIDRGSIIRRGSILLLKKILKQGYEKALG